METPLRRRWLRFSLRGLFVVVTALTLWLGWNVYVVRERKVLLAELSTTPGVIVWRGGYENFTYPQVDVLQLRLATIPQWRVLLGDEAVQFITFSDASSPADLDRARDLFPEAWVDWRNEVNAPD